MESRLPKHIKNSIAKNRTSLGEHPSFPPDEEEKFLFKVVDSFYNTIDDKVKDNDFENMKKELSSLLKQARENESSSKEALEQLCMNVVCELFQIPEDTIEIKCSLVDTVDTSNQRYIPERTDDYTFDDISDMKNLTEEVYKRRLLNCLVCGASSYYANNISSYVQELFKINPELPNLYRKISELNNKLIFLQQETLNEKSNNDGGKVDVNISSQSQMVSINAEGIIFPVLLSETIKGLLELSIAHGLPKNKEKAEYVMKKADFRLASLWDERIGIPLWIVIENVLNESGHTVEEVGINFILMRISQMPSNVFNTFFQEVFKNTKTGKRISKALIDSIVKEKSRDDFEDYMNQNMNTDKYQLDDSYFTSEELVDDGLLQEEESDINRQNPLDETNGMPFFVFDEETIRIGKKGTSLKDYKLELVLEFAGYKSFEDYRNHQNQDYIEASGNFSEWLDFVNVNIQYRGLYFPDNETITYTWFTPYKGLIGRHLKLIEGSLGIRMTNPKVMKDNKLYNFNDTYKDPKYEHTPDRVLFDGSLRNYKDKYAYPFMKTEDRWYFGEQGTMHNDIVFDIVNQKMGFRNKAHFSNEIARLEDEGKYNEVSDLNKRYDGLMSKLLWKMRNQYICGRVWTDIQVFAYWNENVDINTINETIHEARKHFKMDFKQPKVVSDGEIIDIETGKDITNDNMGMLRAIHLMNQKDKQAALTDFKRLRGEKNSRKLGKMTNAQYHNLIYQESVIREGYNIGSVEIKEINEIQYVIHEDEDGEKMYDIKCLNYNGDYIYDNEDMYDYEVEELLGDELSEKVLNNEGYQYGDEFIISDIISDSYNGSGKVEDLNKLAKRLFNTSDEYYHNDRGYILTDGVILEFGENTDHLSICALPGMTLGKFVALGAIRIGHNSIYLQKPPTREQRMQLMRLIKSYSDEDLYVDIVNYNGGNYADNLTSAKYVNPDYRLVLGEIDRFFSEGIKLTGGYSDRYESKEGNTFILTEQQYSEMLEESATSLEDIYNKYYSKIPKEDFLEIIASDPTSIKDEQGNPKRMGNYCKWLLKVYSNKNLKLEDLYKATEYLTVFNKKRKVIEGGADINRFKSLQDLFKTVQPFIEDKNLGMSNSEKEAEAKKGGEKVYEDDTWIVVIPHTKEAAIYYGKNTQWCTAAEQSHNYFDHYNEQGELYININKKTNEKYQFHFESDQFMDETDTQLDSPIIENIPMTSGLVNFYKDERDETDFIKIVETKYDYTDSNGEIMCTLCSNPYEENWYMRDYDGNIMEKGLKLDSSDIDEISTKLYNDHYILLDNIYGAKTLFVIEHDNTVRYYGYNFVEVYDVYNDEEYNHFIWVIDKNEKNYIYEINYGSLIYKTKEAVDEVDLFNSYAIKITKENGLYDFIGTDYDNSENVYDVVEYQEDAHNYLLRGSLKNGNHFCVSLENLQEVEDELYDNMEESKKMKGRIIKLSETQMDILKKWLEK